MGDHEFDAGLNWWNTPRTSKSASSTAFEGSSSSTSCSAPIPDGAIDSSSTMQIPSFPMDWNQSLLRSSTSGKVEPSFHAMLQEPLNYHHQLQHIGNQDMMLQGLFEPELKPQQQTIFDQRFLNCEALRSSANYGHGSSSDLLAKFPQFLNSSPPKQQISCANSLQFSNNAAFWNATASAISYPSTVPVQFGACQSYEKNKPSCSGTTTKTNFDSAHKKNSSGNSSSSEPAVKKTRIETPSPLPTFKVRKEKLGDRITALQQLVSPFGKTDTASVLHEAIEYIKFLHDQVNVLTTPYLKNGQPMQHQQSSEEAKQDLRTKGLCLVPIESTYPVTSETTADFWTPTFGGTFR